MQEGCSFPPSNVLCELFARRRRDPEVNHSYSRTPLRLCSRSVPCFALLARHFELVAGLPPLQLRSHGRLLAKQKSKSRYLRKPAEIHLRAILVARLVIVVIHIVLRLRRTPRCVVAFVFQAFADGKRRNAYAGQTEMVGAVVVPGFGTRIRSNRQVKCFCHRLHYWIKRGALRPAYFYLFGITNWCERIIIQVEGTFRGGNGGVLAHEFGAQQPLLLRGDRVK